MARKARLEMDASPTTPSSLLHEIFIQNLLSTKSGMKRNVQHIYNINLKHLYWAYEALLQNLHIESHFNKYLICVLPSSQTILSSVRRKLKISEARIQYCWRRPSRIWKDLTWREYERMLLAENMKGGQLGEYENNPIRDSKSQPPSPCPDWQKVLISRFQLNIFF